MLAYVLRRILYVIPLLFALSVIVFLITNLQPGNYCTSLKLQSDTLYEQCVSSTGIDQPLPVQYGMWIWNIVTKLDFGFSYQNQQPVINHLFTSGTWESGVPIFWTLVISFGTMIISWLIAVPLGIFAATKQGTWRDYTVNFLGFVGLSIPNFFLAIGILWLLVVVFQVGQNCWESTQLGETVCLGVSGLFDGNFVSAAWSWEKFTNLMWHLWPAVLVIGASNIAAIARYMRSEMIDVLNEPFVWTARSKGLGERKVIWKHALKNAINPLISMLGYWLPAMFEGTLVASMILQLPTVERVYWTAIRQGDQFVIMAGLLFFGTVLIIGNLISDLLLGIVNPKIRYE